MLRSAGDGLAVVGENGADTAGNANVVFQLIEPPPVGTALFTGEAGVVWITGSFGPPRTQ
jgi:hypothetical protein